MAGAGDKKAAARRNAALRYFGLISAFAWLVASAAAVLSARGGGAVTRWAAVQLLAQAALSAFCVWMVGRAAAVKDDAGGGALSAGASSGGGLVFDPFSDFLYVTAACQLLSAVWSGGWRLSTYLPLLVLALHGGYFLYGFFAQRGELAPGATAATEAQAEALKSKAAAKRERQAEEARRRAKGIKPGALSAGK